MPSLLSRSTTLAYTDDGSGPAVVLVHGSASSRGQWRSLALRLAPRYRILAPDLHGYGGTPPPPVFAPFTIDDEVALIDALVDLAGGDVHLVGHSYGAALCLRAASRRPERVRSLTAIEPTAFQLLRLAGERTAWDEVERVATRHVELADAGELLACTEHFLGYWGALEGWRQMPPDQRARIVQTMPKIAQEWRMVLGMTDAYEELVSLALPTLLVRGAKTTAAARIVVELLRDRLPSHAFLEIAGAGHLSPLTHPAAVNVAIEAFLERHR
ncbi:MAG TPA: alpha/beta hydrolase [Burkholderiales bacterium]|nr:alpha/beta hydrolase [Burkholderiales bacterium]